MKGTSQPVLEGHSLIESITTLLLDVVLGKSTIHFSSTFAILEAVSSLRNPMVKMVARDTNPNPSEDYHKATTTTTTTTTTK